MLNAPNKNSTSRQAAHHFHAADLHGISRLVLLAIGEVIDRVEALQVKLTGAASTQKGVSAFVYRQARSSTMLAGRWVDARLDKPESASIHRMSTGEREAVLAALNGLFGDLLARADNPLAIRMRLRRHGRPLQLEKAALAAALPEASGKLLILAHGLCRSDLQWHRAHHDHGAALARDLGYTPLYLHYNSGRHVSTNGREFSALLEQLVAQWPVPVEHITLLAHSMGGLVCRSACYYARAAHHAWLARLEHMIFLGTPHHGAPLERHGNWLGAVLGRNSFTAPFARLGEIRSAGITDLRYGNLLDEDWHGRNRFEHTGDLRRAVPLPRAVNCYAIAGTTGQRAGDIRDRLLGDGLIPLDTALGRHDDPARTLSFRKSRQWIGFGIHHLDLLSSVDVYETIRAWLAPGHPASPSSTDSRRDQRAPRSRTSRSSSSLAAPAA
jgi:hypothetical protein